MRRLRPAILLLVAAAPALAAAEGRVPLDDDPALARLVSETLEARPELRSAHAMARAEHERVPQAGALPDPVLSLGLQNDGFGGIQVGKMETSYYSIGLAQTFPFPGKRALRAEAAAAGASAAIASLDRARLGAEADMRRAYVDLVLVRDRLALLGRLEALWARSEGTARSRYESGVGAQTDLLRAQLERTRLRQRRVALEAEERARRAVVNRLRGQPAGEPVETIASLEALADPALPERDAALADAEARSPELASARAAAQQADREAALARRERFPDVTLSAGLMPRGALEPMWQVGLSVPLPIFSGRKQSRAVAMSAARAENGVAAADAFAQVVRLRALQREESLAAALETLALYRGGLLVQSRATAESALAQYVTGRVPFASVLEALAGTVSDEEGFLGVAAEAQRLWVAAREVSLDEALPGGAAGAGGGMPGAGGAASAAAPARAAGGGAQAAATGGSSSSSSSSMGGGM
ncbi:outer membrane efflux protein [Anaeromyxobacter dehalogenans 2CP-1]|uniref:Outer membrane efflux protein n=1 Tax=Anaeromyxobacter dehalogenans (strain ATCC BAA-258 / DSM 21875 / 2CP-1) TaxID=455488 RepID=B8JAS5_ANAD2|nr:TolC family protein [Anaeromyxobacter dehalogenans]ACL67574.1 outer membrane efflux protein [Anaeromyxobacter dehalogenans 2CP-1]